jgi:Na+-transporting methylmalonyl-CoA/oxaloacetate decarboxylase gamma subunit
MINRIILFFILVLAVSAWSVDEQITESITLRQFSEHTCIPVRKVIEYLELPQDSSIDQPLAELNRSSDDLKKVINRFKKNKPAYSLGIVLIGMGTVFASLILVALVIGQLRHLDKKKRKSIARIPAYSTAGLNTSEEDEIVAAIVSTIFLYELEVEEDNRLMLTWKRTPLSMWKAARFIPMNEIDPSRRK